MPLQHIQHPVDVLQQPVGKAPFFLQRLLQLHVLILEAFKLVLFCRSFHPILDIPSIPEEISFSHNRIIKGFTRSASNNLRVMNEYEILQSASAKSDAELLQEGYGEDTISQIRDGTIAELIRKSIFSRASLPSSELSELGYTESEIEYMKSLTGTETLADLSTRGILADCYTYNTFVSHTYNKSKDKTYFICNYGWEWDKCPNWVLTDCAGLGWNHDFHPDDAVDSDYNKTFKTYVNQGNASDKKYTTKHIYEKELQTAEDQFDMNGFYGSDYYVKSGSGTICLSQTGKVNDVKLSFKYGHNQFGPAVSVSYPWGVSFGLDGAETIFQPDEIVYNDFATVK